MFQALYTHTAIHAAFLWQYLYNRALFNSSLSPLSLLPPSLPPSLSRTGSSILHSFTKFGCYDIVKLLWEKGARPTILHGDNSTLLHSAVCSQGDTQDEERSKILRFFLSTDEPLNNCMSLNHRNLSGWTALKLAARRGLEKCVEILVDNEADPDIPDKEEFTALHNAVGNPDILKMLATKSRKIDAGNKEGETPLYLAAERGLLESALVLLEYGADPNIPNNDGKFTPKFEKSTNSFCDKNSATVAFPEKNYG